MTKRSSIKPKYVGSNNLTGERLVAVAGMAHFSGLGPIGRNCGDCRHYYGNICGLWVEMMRGDPKFRGRGIPVPSLTPSCKEFTERPKRKW
jgi:hypothetical protein